MTPAQLAQLRAEAAHLTTALGPMLLRGLGPSGSLIQASLRVLGWDSATLLRDPLAGAPDEAVATLATLLHRRLTELGAGGPAPTEAQRAASFAAIFGAAPE